MLAYINLCLVLYVLCLLCTVINNRKPSLEDLGWLLIFSFVPGLNVITFAAAATDLFVKGMDFFIKLIGRIKDKVEEILGVWYDKTKY